MMFTLTKKHVAAMAAKDAEIEFLRLRAKLAEDARMRETERANRITGRWLDVTKSEVKAQLARVAMKHELSTARATLAQIAAMETPSCASIGRRMAAAARGGVAPAAAPVAEGAR